MLTHAFVCHIVLLSFNLEQSSHLSSHPVSKAIAPPSQPAHSATPSEFYNHSCFYPLRLPHCNSRIIGLLTVNAPNLCSHCHKSHIIKLTSDYLGFSIRALTNAGREYRSRRHQRAGTVSFIRWEEKWEQTKKSKKEQPGRKNKTQESVGILNTK